jgi:ribosome recycling factor
VEAYGELMPLNQVGNIQLLDARTVIVKLYDQSQSKAVVSALAIANLGVNPVADSNGVKLSFPPITEETRKVNVKKCKETMEQAKVRIRQVREETKAM